LEHAINAEILDAATNNQKMEMDHHHRAKVIIEEVLNLALNRHLHLLEDAGYLNLQNLAKGWRGEIQGKSQGPLHLKNTLIDEICLRLEPAIADYLANPREDLWPISSG
jgi:hypothetical protein